MSSVQDYHERLATLQGAWDTLAMLSHLGGDGIDMGSTRQAFESLASELVGTLSAETYRKSLLALKAKGQIAIDVMVRNLYERTADIGFLCSDDDLREYLKGRATATAASEAQHRLRARFAEYVAKYSVYHDVVLLAPDGRILVRLDERHTLERSQDPLIAATLSTHHGYVETFRRVDLLPDAQRSLVYSYTVSDNRQVLGILCLCFRFEDEVAGIFSKLQEEVDWSLFCYLDARGQVIASSDIWQLPIGAMLPLALDEGGSVVRFAGREYLAVTRQTSGYQGYLGPGWYGQAMIPLEHAFERKDSPEKAVSAHLPSNLRASEAVFSAALRRIPVQADRIQRELNRTIWNGNVRLATRQDANRDFAKTLLWEVGNAGRRTQDTFEKSIGDLQETVISCILHEAQLLAALSVDVLDRNLYERANDCRWWALNATLIQSAHAGEQDRAAAVLRQINSLYTVYDNLVLFDAQRRVIAVSNPVQQQWVGRVIDESWAAQTLALRSSQEFAVSAYAPSALYDNQPTLIFGGVMRDSSGRTVGGIGIVFDGKPQLDAMLKDALPRNEAGAIVAGCIGLFVDQEMHVLAATAQYAPGDRIDLPRELFTMSGSRASRILTLRGTCYAVGIARTTGYREYKGAKCIGLVLIPLGSTYEAGAQVRRAARSQVQRRATGDAKVIDIATFHTAGQWLGLPREYVIEAVEGEQLRALPGCPGWHAGLLMYRERPIMVIDLARLMNATDAARGRDVIVAGLPGSAQVVGLLIDELTEIPEIPVHNLVPVTELATHSSSPIIDCVVRAERSDEPVLFVLSLERVLFCTGASRNSSKTPTPLPVHRLAGGSR